MVLMSKPHSPQNLSPGVSGAPQPGQNFNSLISLHFLLYCRSTTGTEFLAGFQFRPALPTEFHGWSLPWRCFGRGSAADHFLQSFDPCHQGLDEFGHGTGLMPKARSTPGCSLKREEMIGKCRGRQEHPGKAFFLSVDQSRSLACNGSKPAGNDLRAHDPGALP